MICSMYTVAHRDLEAPGDINFRPQLKLAMSSGRHYIRFLKGSSFSYATNANCKEEQTQRKANSLELLALNYFVRQKGGTGRAKPIRASAAEELGGALSKC